MAGHLRLGSRFSRVGWCLSGRVWRSGGGRRPVPTPRAGALAGGLGRLGERGYDGDRAGTRPTERQPGHLLWERGVGGSDRAAPRARGQSAAPPGGHARTRKTIMSPLPLAATGGIPKGARKPLKRHEYFRGSVGGIEVNQGLIVALKHEVT